MTSRERVQCAIEKSVPDRVPCDLGSSITGITRVALRGLLRHLDFKEEFHVIVKPLQLAEIPEEVLALLGIDTRYIRPCFPKDNDLEAEYEDEWGVRRRLSSNGYYYDMVDHPLKEGTVRELERFDWPDPLKDEYYRGLREQAKRMYHETDYALVGDPLVPALFEPAWYLRGMEKFLIDLVDNKTFAGRLLDILLEYQMQFFRRFLEEIGDYIQVIMFGDDFGTQNSPLLSPVLFREIIKPRYKRLYSTIKQYTRAKIFLHSCGAVEPLIPDLIDAGVEILHPVQPAARGMDHQLLKSRYGEKLCFWGGVDIQKALISSVSDIREEVNTRIRALGRGGGYVLAPAHNIQPDTPPENIVALYRFSKEEGEYR